MIYVTSIWLLLVIIVLWVINTWLFLAGLRLLLGRLSATRHSRLSLGLAELTDPIVRRVHYAVCRWRRRAIPPWFSWTCVITAAIVLRHLLFQLAVAVGQR